MEAAKMATARGAEVLLTPNACGLDNATLDHFAVRAMENGIAVAMTNYASTPKWHDANNGRSVAYDHLGNQIVLAGSNEGMHLAKIDVAALRKHKASTYGAALTKAAKARHPQLCDFPRREEYQGVGALGRLNDVL